MQEEVLLTNFGSADKYRSVVDSLQEVVFEIDLKGNLLFYNMGALDFFGYSKEDFDSGFNVLKVIAPQERDAAKADIARAARGEDIGAGVIYTAKRKDNSTFPILVHASPVIQAGKPVALRGIIIDITARRRAEEVFKRYQLLSENARDIILFVDVSSHLLIDANSAAVKSYGYSRKELLSMSIFVLLAPEALSPFERHARFPGSDGSMYETVHRRKDGSTFPVEVSSQISIIGNKQVMVEIIRDISERKRAEEQLKYLSFHDSLTGLYNRTYFEREMQRIEQTKTSSVGILVADLDGLKLANDTLGHGKGDELLLAAVQVLNGCCPVNSTISRIGGDEFATILTGTNLAQVEGCYRLIHDRLAQYNSSNPELTLSISIGFAFSEQSANIAEVFKEADNNLYREKLHRKKSARSSIVQTLMKALEARDFITEGHAERLEKLVVAVAQHLGFPEQKLHDLRLLAGFHDIGKVGISDSILFKPGPLSREETAKMRQHCEIGYRIAMSAPDLVPIADWIHHHHEWWNGQGYPVGLKGEVIPLECRILAIADAYDAIVSERPYKKARTHGYAVEELRRSAGTQFDPKLVEQFIEVLESDLPEQRRSYVIGM